MKLGVVIASIVMAISVVIGTWMVIASRLFVWLGGLSRTFPSPWVTWWTYAQSAEVGGSTRFYLIVSGIGAAIPVALAVILIARVVWFIWRWRRLRGPTKPIGGGVRPIVPGVTETYGNAKMLTNDEIRRSLPGPPIQSTGMVVGEIDEGKPGHSDLVIDAIASGNGHCMVVAGTRAGKTTSAVTVLLHWDGSAGVLDPSAEMGSMLRAALEAGGKTVYLLNPRTRASGFNALGWIDPAQPLAMNDVKSMVSWLFPEPTANVQRDAYFEPSAKSMCAVILADMLWSDRPVEEKTLRTFRELLSVPETIMRKQLQTIHARSKCPSAAQMAGTFAQITTKQFSGIYGGATQGCDWLSDPDLANLVSGDAFDVNDIVNGRTVVFAQVDLSILRQSPGIGRVIMGALMGAVYKHGRQSGGRTLMCLDEAHALGNMEIIQDALVVGAKHGLVLQFLYQSTGQAKKIWGDDGMITLYNNLAWRGYASVQDDDTAEMISKRFGEIGAMVTTSSVNAGVSRPAGLAWGNRSTGDSSSTQEVKRRLLLPQEITAAPPDKLFVMGIHGNMKLRTAKYFLRPELKDIVEQSRFVT